MHDLNEKYKDVWREACEELLESYKRAELTLVSLTHKCPLCRAHSYIVDRHDELFDDLGCVGQGCLPCIWEEMEGIDCEGFAEEEFHEATGSLRLHSAKWRARRIQMLSEWIQKLSD